jgi:hypothetical protein
VPARGYPITPIDNPLSMEIRPAQNGHIEHPIITGRNVSGRGTPAGRGLSHSPPVGLFFRCLSRRSSTGRSEVTL